MLGSICASGSLIVHLVKMLYMSQILYADGVGWLGPHIWFNPPKPGLQPRALCGVVCVLSIANSTLLLPCWFYFIIEICVFAFCLHDYNLCFNDSTCYTVSYYNYNYMIILYSYPHALCREVQELWETCLYRGQSGLECLRILWLLIGRYMGL